jgi:hypothetical protein
MSYAALYIYGIIDKALPSQIQCTGIGDRDDPVFLIPYKDIAAIASLTPFIEYDPTEENSLAHEKVIQHILQKNVTIAPMRFCTVLRTRNDALRLLQSGYLAFKRNLLKVRNKVEFDVKMFIKLKNNTSNTSKGATSTTTTTQTTTMPFTTTPITGSTTMLSSTQAPSTTPTQAMASTPTIQRHPSNTPPPHNNPITQSHEIASFLYEKLKTIADDIVLEDQVTTDMILNASVLLRKEQKDHFFQQIKHFDKEVTDKVRIRVSGPTAPYNFVTMPTK